MNTTENTVPESHGDHPVASTLRFVAGVVTAVAGVAGILESAWVWIDGADLPSPLDALLPLPILSKIVFTILSIGSAAGGVLWLRGIHAAVPICSGTWAVVAALAARPSVSFNYSEGFAPMIHFPAEGRSTAFIILFLVASALSVLTHGFSGVTRHATARLASTVGETLVSAFLLIAGLTGAIHFQVDSNALGSVVIEKALLPLMISTLALHALALGVLAGFAIARAGAIVLLLSVGAAALLPDLLFECVRVPLPLFWATVCAIGAGSLFLPRRAIHH